LKERNEIQSEDRHADMDRGREKALGVIESQGKAKTIGSHRDERTDQAEEMRMLHMARIEEGTEMDHARDREMRQRRESMAEMMKAVLTRVEAEADRELQARVRGLGEVPDWDGFLSSE
jgi:hypothetical protein